MIAYLAIDPGASGGLALYKKDGTVEAHPLPSLTYDALDELINTDAESAFSQYTVVIEDVPKFAGRMIPSSATATLHFGFGYLCGHFEARGYRVIKVTPQTWQKTIGIGKKGDLSSAQWKRKLRDEAQRRYPALKVSLATADALLLLDHARQHNL
jgi:hypothetical protein